MCTTIIRNASARASGGFQAVGQGRGVIGTQARGSEDDQFASLADLTNNPRTPLQCNGSFVPVYDRAGTSAYKGGRRIPRYLHLSMKSRCVHELHHKTVQLWKEALPHYSVFFHDDASVERLFKQDWPEFPGLREALKCSVYHGAMQIDIWRILIVYRYGGMYTDIDNWPTRDFTEATIEREDQSFFLRDAWQRPSQWLFAMEPKHPIAFYTMKQIIENVLRLNDIMRPRLVFTTGPMALRSGYGRAMNCSLDDHCREMTCAKVPLSGCANHSSGARIVTAHIPQKPASHFVLTGLQGHVMLAWNVTVSGKAKIEMDTGVPSWSKAIYLASKEGRGGSCRALLSKSLG